jgi:hypothetical protein
MPDRVQIVGLIADDHAIIGCRMCHDRGPRWDRTTIA